MKWVLVLCAALAGIIGLRDALSAEFYVTTVVRDVPMANSEPAYKDVYINAGSNNGLRSGLYLDAIRKMPVYDNINSKLAGDTLVKVARLRLIHVDKNASVARLVRLYDKETTPLSGADGVMIGDSIEVAEKQ